jgi:hypothetical protein
MVTQVIRIKPPAAEELEVSESLAQTQRIAGRGGFAHLIDVEQVARKRIADLTPSDEDFAIAASPPPESWYREKW